MTKMNKDEFKEAMRQAKIDEEVNELMNETEGIEDPEEIKPKRRAGRRRTTTRKTTKAEPVAAGQKKPRKKPGPKPGTRKLPCKKLQEAAGQKTDEEDITKKQEEALKAMRSLTVGYTQQLIKGAENNLKTAEKLTDMAIIYNGYVETVEEMLK